MNRKKNTILVVVLLIFLTLVIYLTYAFFVMGNFNVNNTVNVNILTDDNNMVFDVIGGQLSLSFNAADLKPNNIGNEVANNTSTLTVNFQPNTTNRVVCTYDIVYEWTSTDKYQAHSPGATGNEFTVQATLTNNSNVSEGLNYIQGENDLANLVWDNSSTTVVKNAQIDGFGSNTSTATWTIISKFYNANADQGALAGKTLSGKFKVANVNCKSGTKTNYLVDYLINTAPRSGEDAVSDAPWILTSDHAGEMRYAGRNPDNYIQFNGELWRIIGVMPNMTYCTGEYGTETECNTTETGSLVKIIRNQTISSSTLPWDYKQTGVGSSISTSGSNDWSDSQLMLMLNGTNYLKTGYDVNGTQLHTSYTITSNVVAGNGYNFYNATYSYLDGNGTNIFKPTQASTSSYTTTPISVYKKIEGTALNQIATVKLDLYGTNNYTTAAEGSPSAFYNKERNIGSSGAVYTNASLPENRPVYWYGKIGLMYPSDYGYATNGGTTYNREACLGYQMIGWNSSDYKTDCAGGNFLRYDNITSTAPGTSGVIQWTITPNNGGENWVFLANGSGNIVIAGASNPCAIRPVLYLKADTTITGGIGTWNNPYIIDQIEQKQYWRATGTTYTYPNHGGELQSSGSAIGSDTYVGQDSSKYYACAYIDGREVCLSQPYTQYGLSGHTLNANFAVDQQARAKQALYQTLAIAGIDASLENCNTSSSTITCNTGTYAIQITSNGYIVVVNYAGQKYCELNSNGQVYCYN